MCLFQACQFAGRGSKPLEQDLQKIYGLTGVLEQQVHELFRSDRHANHRSLRERTGGAGLIIDRPHLPNIFTGKHNRDRLWVVAFQVFYDLHLPRDDQIGGVAGLALLEDRLSRPVGLPLHVVLILHSTRLFGFELCVTFCFQAGRHFA